MVKDLIILEGLDCLVQRYRKRNGIGYVAKCDVLKCLKYFYDNYFLVGKMLKLKDVKKVVKDYLVSGHKCISGNLIVSDTDLVLYDKVSNYVYNIVKKSPFSVDVDGNVGFDIDKFYSSLDVEYLRNYLVGSSLDNIGYIDKDILNKEKELKELRLKKESLLVSHNDLVSYQI